MLDLLLGSLADTEGRISAIETHIDAKLEPYHQDHLNLTTIPGVDWTGAASIVAELGADMTVFGTPGRASAWGGVAPGNNERGGRRRRARHVKATSIAKLPCTLQPSPPGAPTAPILPTSTTAFARAAVRALLPAPSPTRSSSPPSTSSPAKSPTANSGADYLDRRAKRRVQRGLAHRLERLGYDVALRPKAA